MMAVVGVSELIAALIGAVIAGAGKLALDWVDRHRQRRAYVSALKAEIYCLNKFVVSQDLENSLRKIIQLCESESRPKKLPSFDFNSTYFHVYENIGSDLKFLNEDEVRCIVLYYTIIKAAFDTIRKDGPLSTCEDLKSLAQMCRFLSSLIRSSADLHDRIQTFPLSRKRLNNDR